MNRPLTCLFLLTFAAVASLFLTSVCALPAGTDSYFVADGQFLSNIPSRCEALESQLENAWCRVAPVCTADSVAKSFLVASRQDASVVNGVPVSVTTSYTLVPGIGHQFTATGFVLAATQGGPGGVLRGLVYIPENHVEGGAYAPLASRVARAGHYAIVLSSITELSDVQVRSLVDQAIALRPDIGAWVLAGHGRGGEIAASIAARDRTGRIGGLALYGTAPATANFANTNIAISFAYGGADSVVLPAAARAFLASRVPADVWALYFASAQHMDFAYSTCLNNSFTPGTGACSPLRFTDPAIAVLSMPLIGSSDKEWVNSANPIVTDSFTTAPIAVLGDACVRERSEFSTDNGATWTEQVQSGRDLSDFLYATGSGPDGIRIEARPLRTDYNGTVDQLQGALVRAHFSCGVRVNQTGCVEFFVHQTPSAVAERRSRAVSLQGVGFAVFGTDTILVNILGVSMWAGANQRALSFFNNSALSPIGAFSYSKIYPVNATDQVVAETIVVPSFNPNLPTTRRWYVFRPADTTLVKGGLIYLPGGAVDARAYAALAFEIAARGYLVVIPTMTQRTALLDVNGPVQFLVPTAIINSPLFSYVGASRWAIGGHSLGGFGAFFYANAVSTTASSAVRALILHAGSISPPGIATKPIRVLQVYGKLDAIVNNPVLTSPFTNPLLSRTVAIAGGNHYQIGDYGYQFPDNVATISIEQQQSLTAQETVQTLVEAGLV